MEPLLDVAPGADAADSVLDGLLEVEPEDMLPLGALVLGELELELGDVVLGVVVVLDDLVLSPLLPHAANAAAATNATIRACFTMSVTSNVKVDGRRSFDLLRGMQARCRARAPARSAAGDGKPVK